MNETKAYYSPDEVAARLGLHVRTVRRFIREGKLKAVRVGKQYRITDSDLRGLMGTDRGQEEAGLQKRQPRMIVSTTVDIDGIDQAEQERLSRLLIGAFQALDDQQKSRRFDSIYYEEERRLRLLINADLDTTTTVLGLIRGVLSHG